MEEKIEKTKEKNVYNLWKARIISILTVVVIVFVYGVKVINRYEVVTEADDLLGKMKLYNIISILLGIVLIVGTAIIMYKLIIKPNDKLSKSDIKNLVWKIATVLIILGICLMNVKIYKMQECELPEKAIYRFNNIPVLNCKEPPLRKYFNIDINIVDVTVYGVILVNTIIIVMLYIKKLLKKHERIEDDILTEKMGLPNFIIKILLYVLIFNMLLYIFSLADYEFPYIFNSIILVISQALFFYLSFVITLNSGNYIKNFHSAYLKYLIISILLFGVTYLSIEILGIIKGLLIFISLYLIIFVISYELANRKRLNMN